MLFPAGGGGSRPRRVANTPPPYLTDADGTIRGKLPDGRDVNVRNHSSRDNTPTLEIQRKNQSGEKVIERTKIRYNR